MDGAIVAPPLDLLYVQEQWHEGYNLTSRHQRCLHGRDNDEGHGTTVATGVVGSPPGKAHWPGGTVTLAQRNLLAHDQSRRMAY